MTRLSLSPLTVLDVGPPDLIGLAADAGFSSVGVRLIAPMAGGIEYPLRPGSAAMTETRQRMADRDVRVFDVEVVVLTPETDIHTYSAMFDSAAELGAERVCVNADDTDRSRTIDRFGALCDLASSRNLALDLEFMIWRRVGRLEDAVAIVSAAGKPKGKILIDALHLFRSGGTVADVAALDPALIGCLQLCDARAQAPDPSGIIDEARGDRFPPGEGALPLIELIDALPADLTFALEVPMSRNAPQLTPLERARRVRLAADALLRNRRAGGQAAG